jgi:hypothetical protein
LLRHRFRQRGLGQVPGCPNFSDPFPRNLLAAGAWNVFPCRATGPQAKSPLTLYGHLDATTDPDQIRILVDTRWPDAMIGAAVPEALLVIDIDPRNGGSLKHSPI